MKDWNAAERAKRLRNYRLFIRWSGPMLVLASLLIAGGVTDLIRGGSPVLLLLGVGLLALSGINVVQVLRSTMKIVELDEHEDARAEGRPHAGA
jgi:hypothetical protein